MAARRAAVKRGAMDVSSTTADQLGAFLPRERILTEPEDIIPYSFDGTAVLAQLPKAVVFAQTHGGGCPGGAVGERDADAAGGARQAAPGWRAEACRRRARSCFA